MKYVQRKLTHYSICEKLFAKWCMKVSFQKRLLIKVERAKEKKNVGKLLKNCDFSMPYHICTAKMKGLTKGGWISERLSLCLKSPKKDAKSLSWALSTKKEDAKESELAPL